MLVPLFGIAPRNILTWCKNIVSMRLVGETTFLGRLLALFPPTPIGERLPEDKRRKRDIFGNLRR
jgi:hypothetical protein